MPSTSVALRARSAIRSARSVQRLVDADQKRAVLRRYEHHARRCEPPLERRRVCSADAQPEQIRSRRHAIDRERAVTAERANPLLRCAHRATVAIAEAVEIVPRDEREWPDVIQSAAEHSTAVIHPVEEDATPNRVNRSSTDPASARLT